jgi:hypothetical protein
MVPHSIGLVLVEGCFDERTYDPLVFFQVILSSHIAVLCAASDELAAVVPPTLPIPTIPSVNLIPP